MRISTRICSVILFIINSNINGVQAQLSPIGYGNYVGESMDNTTWLTFPEFLQNSSPKKTNYPWSISVWGGVLSEGTLGESLTFREGLENSYTTGIGVTKELVNFQQIVSIEAEGQLFKHFGEQTHLEVTSALALRWQKFPWNHYVYTTIAVGEGLSLASEVPDIEDIRREETSPFLNYLLFELTIAPPENTDVSLAFRVHHRSGVFGLFYGVTEGSNIYNLGIRYKIK